LQKQDLIYPRLKHQPHHTVSGQERKTWQS
jgi:hypothetical protein